MFDKAKPSSVFVLFSALMNSGCSNFYWPQHGHSGVAEEHPHMVHWHYDRRQLDIIEMQITNVRQDIHILEHNGATKHYPALMHNIDMQMILVEREFEGHFYKEAENNLIKLKQLIQQAQDKMKVRKI